MNWIPRLFLLTLLTSQAFGQAFITTWKTDNPGHSTSNQIIIYTAPEPQTYAYSIVWELVSNTAVNGSIPSPITGNQTITFPSAGIYRVKISGAFPQFWSGEDNLKLLTVEQWGSIAWKSFRFAFHDCQNLTVPATDAPDLSQVTDMSDMFSGATSFNQPINHWDVSHVTDMSSMFGKAENFNQPLNSWNVSNVIDMSGMFSQTPFNQPIETWDVSSVINMSGMFTISAFNQPIGAWNVSNVKNMKSMFSNGFNQPLATWNVSNVVTMAFMFFGNENFNQPIGVWDVSRVTDMKGMFAGATSFNQPIGLWNVSHVIDMSNMFDVANSFNQPIDDWDVSSVTNMSLMFARTLAFNQPLANWNVSSIQNMKGMFYNARSFDQPIGNWNTGNVTNMELMFANAKNFNQPIGNWDVHSVQNMSYMFTAGSFNQPIGGWNVSSVTNMQSMFESAESFNQSLDNWNVTSVVNMNQMFAAAITFNQSLGSWNISNVTDMAIMLNASALSVSNYDATLIGWASKNVKPNVPLGAYPLKYCLGAAARAQLVSKGWVISGDMSLVPATPFLDIIQAVCDGETGTITVAIQSPTDIYSFDNGANFQASNVKALLSPGQYSVIIKNESGCSSLAQDAVINNTFQKSPMPLLSGSPIVCPNVLAVDYIASNTTYAYQWFIKGGTLQSQQNNTAKVNWGGSNFSAAVKAIGFDEHNCPTDTAIFPVKIQIKLKPDVPAGFDSVCYNFRAGVPYKTSYTNGSVYTWFTDGGIISEGQSTPLSKIDWDDVGEYNLWVNEENQTSTDFCEGNSDTLQVTVFKDLAAITIDFVSVDYDDDRNVQLQWDISLLERVSDLIIVSRRIAGNTDLWETVATLEKNVQSFLDQNVATSTNIYEYKVEGFNKCDEGLQTVIHNTIKLDGDKVEEEELINLAWNDYNGWDAVERYEVWRKLDAETDYKLIDVTPGDLTNYSGKHGADGFVHHLRIKAKKQGANTVSWSNEIELDFENPIDFIPNVITPNGDSKNDSFIIPKLPLYPDNSLTIYDRWGKVVFSQNGYNNNWGAANLDAGIYYYKLIVKGAPVNSKGWLQVIR
jgi:gliding motility-associated-like protein